MAISLTFNQSYPGGRIVLMLGQHEVGAVFPPAGEGQHRHPWAWRFWLNNLGHTNSRANTEQAAKDAILKCAREWLRKAGLDAAD